MPVPQQANIFVELAYCLLYLGLQNRQDACSTIDKYFCGAGILSAIVRSLEKERTFNFCGTGILPVFWAG